MGDEQKKESEGAKLGTPAAEPTLGAILAAINSMSQRMESLEKKSQSQDDWKAEMEKKLASEVNSEEKGEGEKGSQEETKTEEEVPAAITTNNVDNSGNNSNVESESQNGNNEHPKYILIHQGSATVGTPELVIKVGKGSTKEAKVFKDAQDHLTKFRKTLDIRYNRYKKQIEDTDDDDEI